MLKQRIIFLTCLLAFSPLISAANRDNNILSEKFQQAQKWALEGKLQQAIQLYQKLIQGQPDFPEAYNNLASLYLKKNNRKKAKNILLQGLHAHKGYGALFDNLSAINIAMAREAYSKALDIALKPAEINIKTLAFTKAKNKAAVSNNIIPVKKKAQTIKRTTTPYYNHKNEKIETVLQAWAAAWSAQATEMYLSFYHEKYQPANGMRRATWKKRRQLRVKKPKWIEVKLSDFKVQQYKVDQAVVNFKQFYRSNSFQDVSKKQVVLLLTQDGWRIFQERNL